MALQLAEDGRHREAPTVDAPSAAPTGTTPAPRRPPATSPGDPAPTPPAAAPPANAPTPPAAPPPASPPAPPPLQVNHAPSFTPGPNQTILEDAGPQSSSWVERVRRSGGRERPERQLLDGCRQHGPLRRATGRCAGRNSHLCTRRQRKRHRNHHRHCARHGRHGERRDGHQRATYLHDHRPVRQRRAQLQRRGEPVRRFTPRCADGRRLGDGHLSRARGRSRSECHLRPHGQ